MKELANVPDLALEILEPMQDLLKISELQQPQQVVSLLLLTLYMWYC
jgi:hypothetical protein